VLELPEAKLEKPLAVLKLPVAIALLPMAVVNTAVADAPLPQAIEEEVVAVAPPPVCASAPVGLPPQTNWAMAAPGAKMMANVNPIAPARMRNRAPKRIQ
jgi:hypothetical protein